MASSEVLIHYDPDIPLKLICDASAYGVGAVQSHVFPNGVERPIAYASRTLTQAKCCGVILIRFGWFFRVPSLHALVFIQKTFCDLFLPFFFVVVVICIVV